MYSLSSKRRCISAGGLADQKYRRYSLRLKVRLQSCQEIRIVLILHPHRHASNSGAEPARSDTGNVCTDDGRWPKGLETQTRVRLAQLRPVLTCRVYPLGYEGSGRC